MSEQEKLRENGPGAAERQQRESEVHSQLRRVYRKPEVKVLGTVDELTRAAAGDPVDGDNFDPGSITP